MYKLIVRMAMAMAGDDANKNALLKFLYTTFGVPGVRRIRHISTGAEYAQWPDSPTVGSPFYKDVGPYTWRR